MVSEGELRETRVFMEEIPDENGQPKKVEVKRRFTLKLKTTYEPRR